jgi:hypothetical protein
LLDALLLRAKDVLAFLEDLSLPFPNTLAERDLSMIKVQQKMSGTFRSTGGATAFCVIRSYLSTMRKQGRSMLAALTAVFQETPFPIGWVLGSERERGNDDHERGYTQVKTSQDHDRPVAVCQQSDGSGGFL